ncbi:GNAT family N-acetyltransferase [Hymenobacter sp. YC55]|uniref:GNAT family N-acetyltransferase n=1 Tax=Hymenobacter sp. YC55 TaxID=3034019 RepID=UPI0023F8C57A|nr:GNAT family N-acetyltransferase [Hymenobacter sp. YC55]MDF7813997.1 GNAT family N-acetyltransferase [Hymenobacter sp. YC55]
MGTYPLSASPLCGTFLSGQGIGSRLLASLRAWLPLPYTLKCWTRNTRALAFYAKHGWRELGSGGQGEETYQLLQFEAASNQPPPAEHTT